MSSTTNPSRPRDRSRRGHEDNGSRPATPAHHFRARSGRLADVAGPGVACPCLGRLTSRDIWGSSAASFPPATMAPAHGQAAGEAQGHAEHAFGAAQGMRDGNPLEDFGGHDRAGRETVVLARFAGPQGSGPFPDVVEGSLDHHAFGKMGSGVDVLQYRLSGLTAAVAGGAVEGEADGFGAGAEGAGREHGSEPRVLAPQRVARAAREARRYTTPPAAPAGPRRRR